MAMALLAISMTPPSNLRSAYQFCHAIEDQTTKSLFSCSRIITPLIQLFIVSQATLLGKLASYMPERARLMTKSDFEFV